MRRRLVLVVGSVTAVALILVAAPLAFVLKRNYQDEELLRLQSDTVASTRGIDLSNARNDPIEVPQSDATISVFDRGGTLVGGAPAPAQRALVMEANASGRIAQASPSGMLVVAVPLSTNERVSGVVLARRDDSVVDSRSRDAWLAIAALAIGIELLALLAAVLIARHLAKPLESLGSLAERLGEGDFSVRAHRTGVAETDAVADALNATAARLGEMVARERRFSTDASHQLRTPLAALRLELESAALEAGPSPANDRALTQVERLDRTIETLLAAARSTNREPAVADLDLALREVEERWRGVLAGAGRPLRTHRTCERSQGAISQAVLSEILQVLLENAHIHGSGAVTVTVRDASDALAIDVADQGPGFDESPVADQPASSSPHDGHGLGLALARSLAQAEGAELRVSRSRPGAVLTLFVQGAASAPA